MKYDFQQIEQRWQDHWENARTFSTPNPDDAGFEAGKPKFYVLDMFPYPSGVGLHVGHPLGYIATDIVARYKKMRGFNVLHPMGFDAFGLPAEQYAVEHNVHPRITTEANIKNMVHQLKRLGMGYDWDRTFATTDPEYVKWTQWIFVQMYHHYFDPLVQRARPIKELIDKLAGEDYYVGIDGELIASESTEDMEALAGIGDPTVHKWHELDKDQQSRLLDEYRLAFMAEVEVNWCPGLGTVLANEEVTNDGRSERGNFPVFKRPLKQWMLRITSYCDRLIDDLDDVAWPENIKLLQRNWIGKSTGAEVDFAIADDSESHADAEERSDEASGTGESIRVFTTRPDTLFGATYMVLAPEHPLVESITTDDQRAEVHAYRALAEQMSSIERQGGGAASSGDTKEKTGVFTGGYAINPVNNERIPVWVADYVMMGYGTGAIMAVPAHDERDYAFASAFGLPIVEVVQAPDDHDITQEAWTGHGQLINSASENISINGLPVDEAKRKTTDWLHHKALGSAKVNYKLRDWLFSRQRYWGEPFPVLHGPDGEIRTVDAADLPVELPEMADFKPSGSDDPDAPPSPPLGRAGDDWKTVTIDGVKYQRELNTMPNWAGSCWYYLRYLDPENNDALVGPDAEQYWMLSRRGHGAKGARGQGKDSKTQHSAPGPHGPSAPSDYHAGGVDLYVGGAEHAVLHLLYARFWHKFLYDIGTASTPEPFGRYFAQGYIQAYCYRDERGMPVEASMVRTTDGKPTAETQGTKGVSYVYEGQPVTEEFGKMGKSLKNAIGPETVCEDFGCDTLRLYEMYMGPLEQSKVWNTADIVGVHRFLNRLWRVVLDEETGDVRVGDSAPNEDLNRKVHATIKRVTEAMEGMHFNVAIAALIELNNALVGLDSPPRAAVEAVVMLLNPIAPHVAEELWAKLGHKTFLADTDWPTWDEAALKVDAIEMPVQVNGKLRGKVMVPVGADNKTITALAKLDENVAEHLEGKAVMKVIVIPKRLINIVAN